MPFYRVTPTSTPIFLPNGIAVERRQRISEQEEALRTLHHAVAHLIKERDSNQQLFVEANQQAIAFLCKAAQDVTRKDRRDATRRYAISWIWDALGWTK